MIETEYTKRMKAALDKCADDCNTLSGGWGDEENDPLVVLLKYKEAWREFGKGLTQLMRMTGYTGDDTIDEKTNYIMEKFNAIGEKLTKATVKDWFSGKRSPQAGSREKMYQLCFALNADEEQTEWFFEHVYLSRCFDCHRLEELIYKFCISKGLSYSEALSMIDSIDFSKSSGDARLTYTKQIISETSSFTSKEQLLDYINTNSDSFTKWNVTAREEIKKLRNGLQDERCAKKDETIRTLLAKNDKNAVKQLDGCSALVRWIVQNYYLSPKMVYDDYFSKVQVYSADFLLNIFLGTTEGVDKKDENTADIPSAVKLSFPSKKNLSDVLNESKNASYDPVRKALVFMKFVNFWCMQSLEPVRGLNQIEIFQAFRDETDYLLAKCGYSELFPGNPHDWLYLYCALNDDPLGYLHGVVTDMRNDQVSDDE